MQQREILLYSIAVPHLQRAVQMVPDLNNAQYPPFPRVMRRYSLHRSSSHDTITKWYGLANYKKPYCPEGGGE